MTFLYERTEQDKEDMVEPLTGRRIPKVTFHLRIYLGEKKSKVRFLGLYLLFVKGRQTRQFGAILVI